jgi:hypothetical protein
MLSHPVITPFSVVDAFFYWLRWYDIAKGTVRGGNPAYRHTRRTGRKVIAIAFLVKDFFGRA